MERTRTRWSRVLAANPLGAFKSAAAKQVGAILADKRITQTEASYIVKDAPSQISLVVTGKIRGFSTDRLIRMLARLGCDVEITVRPAKGRVGKVTHRFLPS